MKRNGQNNFQRGILHLLVMLLLKREDMYGYQMVQSISEITGNRIVTQEGSLYPVLYKLEECAYISCKRVQAGKRLTRLFYHLEESGENELQNLLQEYGSMVDGVRMIMEACGVCLSKEDC